MLKNLLRGFLFLGLLIGAFIYAKQQLDVSYISWLKPVYERPIAVYAIYSVSEIFFGIIPPEVFMIWALRFNQIPYYVYNIIGLAIVSYMAGMLGFWVGANLNQTRFYRLLRLRFFAKYEKYLQQFGAFLIIVASLTPLPFSAIAMLVGSVGYPPGKYLVFSLARFVRFSLYAYIMWEANALSQ